MSAVTDQELTDTFAGVFAKIADGAYQRERDRRLPYAEVEWLRDAGFTRLRVPRELGGFGATIEQFFAQLIELGKADSNLPQLLRGHFAFVESRLVHPDSAVRERWLRHVADGALIGNAQSERSAESFWTPDTQLTQGPDGQWRLNGKKFYSTGSLFTEWINTGAGLSDGGRANVIVSSAAEGVSRIDDWDGFGQRLTGSGTTVFHNVGVAAENIELVEADTFAGSYLFAFLQLVHLATLAGIGRAAVADTVAFVNQRRRNLFNPEQQPRTDPQIQQVVGKIAGASFAADATTLAAARAVDDVYSAQRSGQASQEDFDRADVAAFGAQGQVIGLVLGLVTELFEVGGASAVTERFGFDRHWRNARTLASHNPAIYRDRIVGDYLLNATSPSDVVVRSLAAIREKGKK